MRLRRFSSFVVALLAACAAAVAHAGSPQPDWASLADLDTIEIVAPKADGTPRERTIWLVVVEGVPYIRAGGSSSWDDAIDANPDVAIRANGVEYELRATRVPEGATTERVIEAFRAKYGSEDAFIGLIRGIGGKPRILRLGARAGMPMP